MKVSKILKKIKQNHDNLTMVISDYSHYPNHPTICWQDIFEEGIWDMTQDEVVEYICSTINPMLEKSKSRVYCKEWHNRLVFCISEGDILVEVYMNK